MPIVIRSAETADFPVLWQLATDTGVYLPETDDDVWVAIANNIPVGFIACCLAASEMTVLGIAVHGDYQRQGIATQLHDTARKILQPSVSFLEVRASNHAAQALYACLGYREIGIRKNYYYTPTGGYEHAITMRCDL